MTLSAPDHEEIRQLLARYNLAVDFGDTEGWADCFTPDGVFVCTPEGGPLTGRHAGRAALVAYAASHYEVNQGRARHWNWNLLIDGAGDGDGDGEGATATMICYLAAYSAMTTQAPPKLRVTGVYRDRLAKVDGRWLFTERHIHIDPQPPPEG